MSNTFVVCMGIGTVFIGLVSIIFLCLIMSAIIRLFEKKSKAKTPVPTPVVEEKEENRQEIIAAVSAAIAEDLGKDISAIRILSFKKI